MASVELLEKLRQHVLLEASFSPALLAQASRSPELTTLAALDEAGALREAVLAKLPASWAQLSPLELLLVVQSEDEAREDSIDDALASSEQAPRAAGALARAGALWEHDALFSLLTDARHAQAAASVLSAADPEGLDAWLSDVDEIDFEILIQILRARAIAAEEPIVEPFEALHEAMSEDDPGEVGELLSRLASLIALISPGLFARGFLRGAMDHAWLQDSAAVADFLSTHGETSWLETLALLELADADGAFEFASMLAVGASAGLLEADETDASSLLDLLRESRQPKGAWEPRAIQVGFQLAVALGDEDLSGLLVEVATHERLIWNDHPSLGVQGLPLSSNDESSLDLDAARSLLMDVLKEDTPDDDVTVAIVRTLCDLRRLHEREVSVITPLTEDPDDLIPQLCDHQNPAINLAARRLITQLRPISPLGAPTPTSHRDAAIAGLDVPGSPALLAELAARDGVASLWAAAELSQLPLEDAFPLLAAAWASCAPVRGAYLRALIRDLLEDDSFTY